LVDSTNKSIEKYNEQIKQRHEAEQAEATEGTGNNKENERSTQEIKTF